MQKLVRTPKFLAFLLISLLATVLTTLFLLSHATEEIESRTWDWRLQLIAEDSKPDPRIKIIMIDQTSLEKRAKEEGQFWPWPRSLYNPVLYFLQKAGARGVAFDMLFTEQSNYEADDQELAKAIGSTIPSVIALALRNSESSIDLKALEIFKQKHALPPFPAKNFSYVAFPIPELMKTATLLGNVSVTPDSDGNFRHTSIGGMLLGTRVLNLPFALYQSTVAPVPLDYLVKDDKSDLLVHFNGGANTYPLYSVDAIIQSWIKIEQNQAPFVPLSEFKDSFVFVGANAPGLLDLRPTPLSDVFPGVEFNATVFDNLLNKNFLTRVSNYQAIPVAAFFIVLVTAISLWISATFVQVFSLLLTFSLFIAGVVISAYLGYWFPLVKPLFGMFAALIPSLIFQYRYEGGQHRFIKGAFSRYVSPEVIEKIVQDPGQLSLGGERRELTIFFSDIAGFTNLAEKMEPSALVKFLNTFLSEMTDIILASGGTIDKYEGDAIMAFWNAPLSVPDHAERAVKAAMACQARLSELAPAFQAEFGIAPTMRVGMNTGMVTVGNFGSTSRFNYTIIGDAVNLASRLESANKVFGTDIMVSDATADAIGSKLKFRKLGEIKVVGKEQSVAIFQPVTIKLAMSLVMAQYNKALGLYESGLYQKALVVFQSIESDSVARAYVKKIEEEGEDVERIWTLRGK